MSGFPDTNDSWSDPLLRWAGSKRQLLPQLLSCVPSTYSRYIEPFAGSGCLFFALRPETAVLGDINSALIETYQEIRAHPRLVSRAVQSFRNTLADYYRVRRMDPRLLGATDRAARFVYLNRHCFNGVYRVNRLGQFNVPRGTKTGSPPPERAFVRCSIALRQAELRSTDYLRCISDVGQGDFVYLDPPYASRRRNTHGEYGYGCFDESRLPEFMAALTAIDRAGATFLASYCAHSSFAKLPTGWCCARLRVKRHVAGFAQHRKTVREILVSNRSLDRLRNRGDA